MISAFYNINVCLLNLFCILEICKYIIFQIESANVFLFLLFVMKKIVALKHSQNIILKI